jgi:hypothetical protein
MEDIKQLLLSQTAVFVYEMLIMAVLVVLIVILSKKRKHTKQMQMKVQERQAKQLLNDSLSNQRRRANK